jgi:hypothetical protein
MWMETLAGAIDDLGRRGFTANLSVVGNQLRVAGSRTSFQPKDLVGDRPHDGEPPMSLQSISVWIG